MLRLEPHDWLTDGRLVRNRDARLLLPALIRHFAPGTSWPEIAKTMGFKWHSSICDAERRLPKYRLPWEIATMREHLEARLLRAVKDSSLEAERTNL